MKHDEKYLQGEIKDNFNFLIECNGEYEGDLEEEIETIAKEYAEHQDRWRPITERPEVGQEFALHKPASTTNFLHLVWSKEFGEWCDEFPNQCKGWQWKPVTMPENGA